MAPLISAKPAGAAASAPISLSVIPETLEVRYIPRGSKRYASTATRPLRRRYIHARSPQEDDDEDELDEEEEDEEDEEEADEVEMDTGAAGAAASEVTSTATSGGNAIGNGNEDGGEIWNGFPFQDEPFQDEPSKVVVVTSTPTLTVTPSSLPTRPSSRGDGVRGQWPIITGVAIGCVLFCTMCYCAWKWRRLVLEKVLGMVAEEVGLEIEKSEKGGDDSDDSNSDSSGTESTSSTRSSSTRSEKRQKRKNTDRSMPRKPPSTVAPSSVGIPSKDGRRGVAGCSWVTEADSERCPITGISKQHFYLEAAPRPSSIERQVLGSKRIFSLANSGTFGGRRASSEAIDEAARFSWATPIPNVRRLSMDSEPQRFRTVDSWVSIQADRTMKNPTTDHDLPPRNFVL